MDQLDIYRTQTDQEIYLAMIMRDISFYLPTDSENEAEDEMEEQHCQLPPPDSEDGGISENF